MTQGHSMPVRHLRRPRTAPRSRTRTPTLPKASCADPAADYPLRMATPRARTMRSPIQRALVGFALGVGVGFVALWTGRREERC